MTPDEAIKELEGELKCEFRLYPPSFRNAIKLGIEALKFIADYRERAGPKTILPLKGETEDKEKEVKP